MEDSGRNFDTISPSAKALLLMKSLTEIPFAKDAAKLIWTEEELKEKSRDFRSRTFIGRLVHFENRYWSVDELLNDSGITNIMEVSSGFSFRGLDAALNRDVFYIDTDLENVIEKKKDLLYKLLESKKTDITGRLLTEPLNVLNEDAFMKLADRFPPGPVCIVNEGLLMYLNMEEKLKLAAIVHKILLERGGCWITADIYVSQKEKPPIKDDSKYAELSAKFLADHHVEENKFESFEAAEKFFSDSGFRISKAHKTSFSKLSSLKYAASSPVQITEEMVNKWSGMRTSWQLSAI